MKCPKHPEQELRIEYRKSRTGFCDKCLNHYDCCTKTKHMDICDQLAGHEGPHRTKRGLVFVD